MAGKMVSGDRGAHARINADKKNAQSSSNPILKTQLRPVDQFHDNLPLVIKSAVR
jgi:hypothetical protein